jgi:hypothetical protein
MTTEHEMEKYVKGNAFMLRTVPAFMRSEQKNQRKATITRAGLLYLTGHLPNKKVNCYPLGCQLRSESIMSQFQPLHTPSEKKVPR